jgi:hypothetical protein
MFLNIYKSLLIPPKILDDLMTGDEEVTLVFIVSWPQLLQDLNGVPIVLNTAVGFLLSSILELLVFVFHDLPQAIAVSFSFVICLNQTIRVTRIPISSV